MAALMLHMHAEGGMAVEYMKCNLAGDSPAVPEPQALPVSVCCPWTTRRTAAQHASTSRRSAAMLCAGSLHAFHAVCSSRPATEMVVPAANARQQCLRCAPVVKRSAELHCVNVAEAKNAEWVRSMTEDA